MNQSPSQILGVSDAEASSDGTVLCFTLLTARGESRLCCPAADIGEFLAFFGHAAVAIGEMTGTGGAPTNDLVPIPATGLGFQAGPTPDVTYLVVNIGGFGLAFEVPSSDLAGFAERISQVARTLSVNGGSAQ